MEYLSKKKQLEKAIRLNEQLAAENEQLRADLDYVAMVANVELDEGEQNEQAVSEN